ncbi:MAG: UPF0280 family protein [Bacteroidota bacterium]
MNRERFRFFRAMLHESDLWIGVPHAEFKTRMQSASVDELLRLRKVLEGYMAENPEFGNSKEALPLPPVPARIPEEIRIMLECGRQTCTGPMSAVAGLFAEYVGTRLTDEFKLKEVVVENGGDLYLKNRSELISVIHAGTSKLSDKMAFVIPPGARGICTSSGTMGHSLSYGKADALTVIAGSTPLADAWATSLANRIKRSEDIEAVLDHVSGLPDLQACAIIAGDHMGVRGEIELKLIT